MKQASEKKILLGVSGSIAAYRACDLITALREAGYLVTVAMTKDAHHFITTLTLQSLAGRPLVDDFFQTQGRVKPVHIELAQQHDLILIAPASADIIAKLAHGMADDILTCTVLASEAPLMIAPAMNEKMYYKPVTQENIEKLKVRGAVFINPIEGHLVCMEKGMGHLAEVPAIVKAVKGCLKDA